MNVRSLRLRLRMLQRRIRQFVVHQVLHADDPPHRLALGMAIGVFVTFTPTIGFQMMLVVLFAWLLRANKVVGLPIVWLTNPATIVPLYYPCYVVGRVLLNEPEVGWQWWRELRTPPPGWWAGLEFYWSRMLDIAVPLWLGCLVVATLLGFFTYYVGYIAICWYRMKRWGQLTKPAQ